MKEMGHIYLIQASGTNRYKIGLTTRSVEDRLRELNSSQSAYPLFLQHSIHVSDVRATEKLLHREFQTYRIHGEWFAFTNDELSQVRRRMIEIKASQSPLNRLPQSQLPQMPRAASPQLKMHLNGWISPILTGLALVVLCRQCEFFHPVSQSNNNGLQISKPHE